MRHIENITIWKDGVNKVANRISLKTVLDDFDTQAIIKYQLIKAGARDEVLTEGVVNISGADYNTWNGSHNSSYNYVATALNLTLV